MHKSEEYINKNAHLVSRSISLEGPNGLVIVEAYFGYGPHIYHIDAGIIEYKKPNNVEEYDQC